jgi:hypothetical protein
MNFSRKFIVIGGFAILLLVPEGARITGVFSHLFMQKTQHAALENLPPQMLWAWQRPEDLRDLPTDIGVAYVATSITIEGETATVLPRQHPLLLSRTTARVPVVHVDASWRAPPALNAAQRQTIVDALLKAVALSNTKVVQLDFEVRRSQRQFLSDVVIAARQQLPPDVALSMTALASWCAGDNWLAKLPADEVVPMAFRMAAGDAEIRALLAKYGRFQPSHCQIAVGTATDEPLQNLPASSQLKTTNQATNAANNAQPKNFRHYRFSPKPWTQSQWQK